MLFNEPKLLKFCALAAKVDVFKSVSVLFNEPKLLKSISARESNCALIRFSALQRAEIAEISTGGAFAERPVRAVSVLFNEPKLLKFWCLRCG